MGQEIVYCYRCQTRLLGSDFEKGAAFRVGAQVSCPDCVRGLFASLPPAQVDAEIARLKESQVAKKYTTTSRIPVVRAPDTSAKIPALPGDPPKSRLPLIIGGVIAVGVVALIALFSGGPSRTTRPEPPDPTAPVPASAPAPAPAPSALPPGAFADLDRGVASRVESDEFSAAARELERARSRRSEAAWIAGIDERQAALEKKAFDALPRFLEPALAASNEGRADEVERLRGFIAAIPAVAAEFDRRVAVKSASPKPGPAPSAPKPAPPKPAPPKPPPSELAAYKPKWEAAMAARDPAKIVATLEGVLKGLKAADAKAEAAADIALVKLAVPLRDEALAALTRLPKDQRVKLDFSDDASVVGSFEGTVQSADAVRIRLSTDAGALDLPVSELSDETLGRLHALRGDGKAAAVWCALRSLPEAAAKLDATLPAKYVEVAKRPAPREADPDRRAFWQGYVDAGMIRSRAAGLDRLAKLQAPRYRPFIDLLLEGAKEAFFSGTDLTMTGTWAAQEREKVGTVWLSTTDVKTGHAAAEVEYYALADQPYRAWVLAGGCCQEVFGFTVQATGLKGIDPKTKEETSYEPGDATGQAVKIPLMSLKKLHSQHVGPKEPDRWDWIPVPLPKAEAAGAKKLRLLTDQKGFAIAHVVVSATRKGPPGAAELKELLRDRPTSPRFTVSPGPASGKPTRTAYYGGHGGGEFEEPAPAGAVLVGFKYSAKGSGGRMKYLQAIYRLGEQTSRGGNHGSTDTSAELVAKPGYAVGQMVMSTSDRLDGFKLVFMRQSGGRLLAGDSYESPWVGAPLKGEAKTLGDGSAVGGIFGHAGNEVDGVGLLLLK